MWENCDLLVDSKREGPQSWLAPLLSVTERDLPGSAPKPSLENHVPLNSKKPNKLSGGSSAAAAPVPSHLQP